MMRHGAHRRLDAGPLISEALSQPLYRRAQPAGLLREIPARIIWRGRDLLHRDTPMSIRRNSSWRSRAHAAEF